MLFSLQRQLLSSFLGVLMRNPASPLTEPSLFRLMFPLVRLDQFR